MVPLRVRYDRDGFVASLRILAESDAGRHRSALEAAEEQTGPLHYWDKMHTVLTSPLELATHPAMLDVVESILGPDILLYNVVYIVKEPQTPAHVAWHQDLTYWGFDSDRQVSAWLALSPATEESGCMMMLPGSHRGGRREHRRGTDGTNVLDNDQYVDAVDDTDAVPAAARRGLVPPWLDAALLAPQPERGPQDRPQHPVPVAERPADPPRPGYGDARAR